MDLLIKMSSLFDQQQTMLSILIELNNLGLIAGGSVVYACNSFVESDSVSDIDVFVNSVESFWNAINCIETRFEDIQYEIFDYYNQKTCSLVNLIIPDEKIKIQIIYREYETPFDVFDSFDLDYVCCGITNNELYLTPECEQSHKVKKICHIKTLNPEIGRFEKAIKKGFNSPIFGYHREPVSMIIVNLCELRNFDVNPMIHGKYIRQRPSERWINIENLCVDSFKIIDYYDPSNRLGDGMYRNINRNDPLMLTGVFILKTDNFTFESRIISHEIDVDSCFGAIDNVLCVSTQHPVFNNINNLNQTITKIGKGTFCVGSYVYYHGTRFGYARRLTRQFEFNCKIKRFLADAYTSIPFAENFKIDILECLSEKLPNFVYYKPCNLYPKHQSLINEKNVCTMVKYLKHEIDVCPSSYTMLITLLHLQNQYPFKNAIENCYNLLDTKIPDLRSGDFVQNLMKLAKEKNYKIFNTKSARKSFMSSQ